MARCENVILNNLPYGFKHLKSKEQILMVRDSDVTEEYKTPIGASVSLTCELKNLFVLFVPS